MPAILAVVALVLLRMLRSKRLAVGLLATVALTATSAAGVTVAASRYVLDFAGIDVRIHFSPRPSAPPAQAASETSTATDPSNDYVSH